MSATLPSCLQMSKYNFSFKENKYYVFQGGNFCGFAISHIKAELSLLMTRLKDKGLSHWGLQVWGLLMALFRWSAILKLHNQGFSSPGFISEPPFQLLSFLLTPVDVIPSSPLDKKDHTKLASGLFWVPGSAQTKGSHLLINYLKDHRIKK